MIPGRSVRAVPTEGTGKREPTTSAKAEFGGLNGGRGMRPPQFRQRD